MWLFRPRYSFLIVTVLAVAIVVSGCGTNSGGHSHGSDGHSHSHGGGGGLSGEPRDIDGDGPRLSVTVEETEPGSYRVRINTERFKMINTAQPSAIDESDTFVGHAHLYVDREMVAMFYEKEYQIPILEPGRHVISVMLSDMDHRPFRVNGKLVKDTAVVEVPDRS